MARRKQKHVADLAERLRKLAESLELRGGCEEPLQSARDCRQAAEVLQQGAAIPQQGAMTPQEAAVLDEILQAIGGFTVDLTTNTARRVGE